MDPRIQILNRIHTKMSWICNTADQECFESGGVAEPEPEEP
jgi:hypothetical protein